MNASTPKFRKVSKGEYDVLLDGDCIGRVRYWETRYNLRRVIVTREWRVYDTDRNRIGSCPTRKEATTFLCERVSA